MSWGLSSYLLECVPSLYFYWCPAFISLKSPCFMIIWYYLLTWTILKWLPICQIPWVPVAVKGARMFSSCMRVIAFISSVTLVFCSFLAFTICLSNVYYSWGKKSSHTLQLIGLVFLCWDVKIFTLSFSPQNSHWYCKSGYFWNFCNSWHSFMFVV